MEIVLWLKIKSWLIDWKGGAQRFQNSFRGKGKTLVGIWWGVILTVQKLLFSGGNEHCGIFLMRDSGGMKSKFFTSRGGLSLHTPSRESSGLDRVLIFEGGCSFNLYNLIFQRLICKIISIHFLWFDDWTLKEWKAAKVQNYSVSAY